MATNIGINRYPEDLGSAEKYHYIIFHICEQTKTSYKSKEGYSDDPIAYVKEAERLDNIGGLFSSGIRRNVEDIASIGSTIGNGIADNGGRLVADGVSAVTPRGLGNFVSGASGAAVDIIRNTTEQAGNINFVRTVRKTKETIALYMPDTLNFIQTQTYQDLSLGNNLVTALFTGGRAVADTIKQFSSGSIDSKAFGSDVVKNISPYLINAAGNAFGDVGKAIAAAGQGFLVNPMIEVLYSSPNLRQFRYDFVFYPRSASEARTVQNIIDLFSFHQAPEILPGSSGYFLVPPSEFDIEFYYAGALNVNIPKVSTCVLTGIDVDYAPNGWAAYEIPGKYPTVGGTGMPVGIKMSLDFKETSIVTKASQQFNRTRSNFDNGISLGSPPPASQNFPLTMGSTTLYSAGFGAAAAAQEKDLRARYPSVDSALSGGN